ICNFDGDLICNICGPAWGHRNHKHSYYSRAIFCGDKIYATYLGSTRIDEEKMRSIYPTQILVFDLQGNYIQTLDVGLRISDLCYDEENNRLLLGFDDDIQFGYLELD
ncbi:MAG: 6-bladed beta-propeller, partial [Tannerellaceae bacterium]|nr:6-bladed beta-propeller [Tannerellaceae bacterium]